MDSSVELRVGPAIVSKDIRKKCTEHEWAVHEDTDTLYKACCERVSLAIGRSKIEINHEALERVRVPKSETALQTYKTLLNIKSRSKKVKDEDEEESVKKDPTSDSDEESVAETEDSSEASEDERLKNSDDES